MTVIQKVFNANNVLLKKFEVQKQNSEWAGSFFLFRKKILRISELFSEKKKSFHFRCFITSTHCVSVVTPSPPPAIRAPIMCPCDSSSVLRMDREHAEQRFTSTRAPDPQVNSLNDWSMYCSAKLCSGLLDKTAIQKSRTLIWKPVSFS